MPKATIYIRDTSSAVIGPADNLSGRIAAILARYEAIIRAAMPTLTKAEWCAIMDANNGGSDVWAQEDRGMMPSMIWANVHDSHGLGEKWDVDQAALVKRLQQMTTAELLAIDEAINRFWAVADLPVDEALAKSWAKVAEAD